MTGIKLSRDQDVTGIRLGRAQDISSVPPSDSSFLELCFHHLFPRSGSEEGTSALSLFFGL